MKLIRVTQIEKFSRYMREASAFDTEQSVIDGISGTFKGNEYTYIGTAFHKLVEGDYSNIEKIDGGRAVTIDDGNTILMDVEQCKVARAYADSMPLAFHEIREYMPICVDGEWVCVTGCADIINGLDINDIKTKYSYINEQDYLDSFQWRMYLQLFEAKTFTFDLFLFEGYKKEKHGLDVRGLPIIRHDPIICNRYNTMETDNVQLISEFLAWSKFRGVYHLLPEYGSDLTLD